jgi:hypothetical protein
MKTTVEVWAAPVGESIDGRQIRLKPVRINPPPIGQVDGSHGSDTARNNARDKLQEMGYAVNSLHWGPNELIVYVAGSGPKSKKPLRKAQPRGPGKKL